MNDSSSKPELVENAKKFLEEDEVKDATTDKKISFLESKGLNSEEIEQLLGVSRNVEASSTGAKVSLFALDCIWLLLTRSRHHHHKLHLKIR